MSKTMIKQTVTFSQFCDGFSDSYKNNFSYEGKRALFGYLEQLSEDIELDPVALCCEYQEFDNLRDYQVSYLCEDTMQDVEDKTTLIKIPDSERFIILSY